MQKSPSPHAPFFTSLKHLKKRLKLENPPPPPPLIEQLKNVNGAQQTDSLGTPIYLIDNLSPTADTNLQDSEAPQQFLSSSPDFPPTHQSLPHEAEGVEQPGRLSLGDDIGQLMQLLRLSDSEELNLKTGVNDDGFYDKIVRVKGPKSVKELERMEQWINHFLNGDKKEPFRLAHLLLGKAAFIHSDDGLVFLSTIDEFLQNEPPID